ncbi:MULTISPECIES: DUF3515 domain-containing protein [unclassified Streptomyces]|uniref:DUF3515 domain-containing protein n=1 Tax=unclassified Streptomyces TaxID=2593676 RepID=UPI0033D3D2E7
MTSSRRRSLLVPAAALALLAAAGCSSTDAKATITVPSPPRETAALCGALHKALPQKLDGLGRNDPSPASELTAGWGDDGIVLRCGIDRPEKMNDPEADGVTVDGVNWLLEQSAGGFRFTTTYRKAYVEVTLRTASGKAAGDIGWLTQLAGPVKKTVPASL